MTPFLDIHTFPNLTDYAENLLGSLAKLSTWMRTHTGPSDGTREMLIDAMALLDRARTEHRTLDPHCTCHDCE